MSSAPIDACSPLTDGTALAGGGYSWFSMWTDSTAIELASAGGNLAPSRQTAHSASASNRAKPSQRGRVRVDAVAIEGG